MCNIATHHWQQTKRSENASSAVKNYQKPLVVVANVAGVGCFWLWIWLLWVNSAKSWNQICSRCWQSMSIIRFMLIKTGQQLRLSQILRCPNKIKKKSATLKKCCFMKVAKNMHLFELQLAKLNIFSFKCRPLFL